MSPINRREIVFIYDVTFANPNGDPNDENKPRIDDETNINYVTDVRLKRTIRDYLRDYKNQDIFIYEGETEEGKRETKAQRLARYGNDPRRAIKECIDLRLFGSTFAINTKKAKSKEEDEESDIKGSNNLSITGPVQFKFGKSLHRVKLEHVKGTTVMPSGEQKEAGTFTEKYILPYSLIAFAGLVNGKVAEVENISLTENDLDLMYEAMWDGTKALFTTSKSQMPQLLIEVVYKDEYFHIGGIEQGLKLISDKMDEEIRSTSDYKIDASGLVELLGKYSEKIEMIRVKQSDNLSTLVDGKEQVLFDALKEKGFVVTSFGF